MWVRIRGLVHGGLPAPGDLTPVRCCRPVSKPHSIQQGCGVLPKAVAHDAPTSLRDKQRTLPILRNLHQGAADPLQAECTYASVKRAARVQGTCIRTLGSASSRPPPSKITRTERHLLAPLQADVRVGVLAQRVHADGQRALGGQHAANLALELGLRLPDQARVVDQPVLGRLRGSTSSSPFRCFALA